MGIEIQREWFDLSGEKLNLTTKTRRMLEGFDDVDKTWKTTGNVIDITPECYTRFRLQDGGIVQYDDWGNDFRTELGYRHQRPNDLCWYHIHPTSLTELLHPENVTAIEFYSPKGEDNNYKVVIAEPSVDKTLLEIWENRLNVIENELALFEKARKEKNKADAKTRAESLPFGKYKDKTFEEVLVLDRPYLEWLATQDWVKPAMLKKILKTTTNV